MKLDPIVVSITAMAVSILSLAVSLYRGRFERYTQIEVMRGEMGARLTSWSVDFLSYIETLKDCSTPEACSTMEKLLAVVRSLVDVRNKLSRMSISIIIPTAPLVVEFQRMKNATDEIQPLVDVLNGELKQNNYTRASAVLDGILHRLTGRDTDAQQSDTPNHRSPSAQGAGGR